MIKRITQNDEFSVVTPEQSLCIEPVDTAFLSMIPEGDPDRTTYLNKLLRTIIVEQQTNIFWFSKPKSSGKIENHSPEQTWIPNEVHDFKKE